jgi:hypothetical protein
MKRVRGYKSMLSDDLEYLRAAGAKPEVFNPVAFVPVGRHEHLEDFALPQITELGKTGRVRAFREHRAILLAM